MTEAVAAAQARALGSPSRRAIVAYLAGADDAVPVGELTEHLVLHHNAVRKHLAKLVAVGLVFEARERRATVGRPRLLYRLAPKTAAADEQSYRRLAMLLAEMLASGDDAVAVGRRAGAASTGSWGGGVDGLVERFAADGFDPTIRRRGTHREVVLGRCPFADAAASNPDTVCRLHLGLAEGMAEHVSDVRVDGLIPRDPHRAGCRVVVSVTE